MKYTAIYDATRKELVVANVKTMRKVRALGAGAMQETVCYEKTDFEYIDSVMLAMYTAEDFEREGWVRT